MTDTCMHNVLVHDMIYNEELSLCLHNLKGTTSVVQTEDMETSRRVNLLNAEGY